MRIAWASNIAAGSLAILACSGTAAADAGDKLTINVDLSEWTPSQTLELDLTSGDYVVTPPVAGWPKGFPMTPRHTGRLQGDVLENVRQLSDRAFASGVNDNTCASKQLEGPPPPPSHAVGPDEFTLVKNGVRIKSDAIYCLTSEAEAMYRIVKALFDHRRP
ncbi:MAG: hypothetical protein K0R27_4796 [Xanthobacteraceae bacterium]|jgi:hypothetical protein|nr:hypothetical protein [Sphingomonas sp.]MDF2999159.1 hypothetical protein [Xanthobacteraceae bacterium]